MRKLDKRPPKNMKTTQKQKVCIPEWCFFVRVNFQKKIKMVVKPIFCVKKMKKAHQKWKILILK